MFCLENSDIERLQCIIKFQIINCRSAGFGQCILWDSAKKNLWANHQTRNLSGQLSHALCCGNQIRSQSKYKNSFVAFYTMGLSHKIKKRSFLLSLKILTNDTVTSLNKFGDITALSQVISTWAMYSLMYSSGQQNHGDRKIVNLSVNEMKNDHKWTLKH